MSALGMVAGLRLPRDPRCLAAIQLLIAQGADQTRHAHERSLLTHLVGTARLLLIWNAPIDTVRAGLCHSIYGTNAFHKISLAQSERHVLQRKIGHRAEALVWLFATLRRPHTIFRALQNGATLVRLRNGRMRHIAATTLQQLFILECANLIDQGVSLARVKRMTQLAEKTRGSSQSAMLRTLRDERRYKQQILSRHLDNAQKT